MLPGKCCIGLLEEDNPLKSYFRLRPLLVENNGCYEEFGDAEEYPEDGCLRIVPDKNESSHFKIRMRRMGRFAVLDLREHALDNDKIRPNKNYPTDEAERNAHIVYSDVVREPAEDQIFEIVNAKAGDPWPMPNAQKIVLADTLEICAEGDGVIAPCGAVLAEDEFRRFDFELDPDKKLQIAVRFVQITVPAAEPCVETQPAPQPEPAVEDKPWLCRDLTAERSAPDSLTGLNPRRSRSLQEIIEEKWRYSRVDQLGHPVPTNAMGRPVQDPVEAALGAIGNVWKNPELHARLIAEIAGMEAFSSALEDRRKAVINSEIQRELDDLEAERLKALNDLDRLRREKKALREVFKQEIRQEEAESLRDCVENTKRAQEEYLRFKKQADEARETVEKLDDVYASLTDGRFEKTLQNFAVTSRAAKFFAENTPKAAVAPCISNESLSADEWIERMQRCFAAEGLTIDRTHAANLLVCAALSGVLFLSGSASSDKSAAARAISAALGLGDSCVILRSFNRCPDMPSDFDRDKFYLCEAADSGSGFPICAETLQQGIMIRLDPPGTDAAWHVCRGEAVNCPLTGPLVLKNAFLSETANLPAVIEHRMRSLRAALASHGVYLSSSVLERSWNYCAAMTDAAIMTPETALDWAFAQCVLPCALAEAPVDCLAEIREMLTGMTKCIELLDSKAPVQIG